MGRFWSHMLAGSNTVWGHGRKRWGGEELGLRSESLSHCAGAGAGAGPGAGKP